MPFSSGTLLKYSVEMGVGELVLSDVSSSSDGCTVVPTMELSSCGVCVVSGREPMNFAVMKKRKTIEAMKLPTTEMSSAATPQNLDWLLRNSATMAVMNPATSMIQPTT